MAAKGEIHFNDEVKDRITGLQGVVVAITDWNNGCERITIQPREIKDGKPVEASTFDVDDLKVVKPALKASPLPSGGPPTRAADPHR